MEERRIDIVERLKAAAEMNGGLHPNEVQELFIEAADEIEYLRSLLEPVDETGLEDVPPQGRA